MVDTVAMILRVWALYNRSRFILAALLTLYATEVIIFLVAVILNTQNGHLGM